MANAFTEAREELAAVLRTVETTAGYPLDIFTFLPESINPPAAVIGAAGPYISSGQQSFRGEFQVHWQVILLAEALNNETATLEIDHLAEESIVALVKAGYGLQSVEQPGQFESNQQVLALPMTVTKTINL